MEIKIAVLAAYFLIVLGLGFVAKSRLGSSPSDYFLAGRGLKSFVLIGTMAATNFSAFTVFGASGAGYRDGMAFFPIMGFGTGFMALSFWLIGRKVWQLGRRHGLVTPAGIGAQNIQPLRLIGSFRPGDGDLHHSLPGFAAHSGGQGVQQPVRTAQ